MENDNSSSTVAQHDSANLRNTVELFCFGNEISTGQNRIEMSYCTTRLFTKPLRVGMDILAAITFDLQSLPQDLFLRWERTSTDYVQIGNITTGNHGDKGRKLLSNII